AVDLPTGGKIEKVDFERHVMGLLSKTGCNAGSCHGSFQGKNGFRLSLFGYEPNFDHGWITRDNLGRRVDVQNPDRSLFLMKGAGKMPHDGGMRFGQESWQYRIFREWIAGGAKHTPGSGEIKELKVSPPDFAVLGDATPVQVKVTATFADGTTEDITPFCDFKISDDAVANLTPLGQLTARTPGDAGLTVLYRGSVKGIRVLVPAPAKPGAKYPNPPANNFIDREVFAKLQLLNMAPSELSSDAEFLRRVTIDTLGILPTPHEVRAFLADTNKDKRTKKIDELLRHPLHAAVWATKLSDITGNNTVALEQPNGAAQNKRSQMWHDWLRKRVADNQRYDELVRDIVTATSADGMKPGEWFEFVKKLDERLMTADGKPTPPEAGFDSEYTNKKTLDLFWRRQQQVPIEQWGEKIAAAFLGVRLECAQCHKHPTDRWTQDDYWSFANLFAPVVSSANQFSSPEAKKLADEENAKRKEANTARNNNQFVNVREMFFATTAANLKNVPALKPIPMTTRTVPSKALGGPELPHQKGEDTRVKLVSWMTDPANPFFARSFVNRVWAHYFGVGLVHPVDDFSQANPPTNARLLDALASEFVKSGYDLRKLETLVLNSRAYQLSSVPNDTNQFDKNNFARGYVRPLMAEQVVDVLNSACDVDENFAADAPAGKKMSEIGASRLNAQVAYALRIFGRPPRTTACDCERAAELALPQTLYRMTDPTVAAKLTQSRRLAALVKNKVPDEQAVEELFLGSLSRLPTDKEKADAVAYIKGERNRATALQDVLWALINTREFILNH
ncbi:MAG: DUF1549 and DUF1553 domain-containing protein, partial [Fimbriiglobus sp.]|nr:DUF1549 and DUF1553 domain-containing protein [Fimbriiglobus sp.]